MNTFKKLLTNLSSIADLPEQLQDLRGEIHNRLQPLEAGIRNSNQLKGRVEALSELCSSTPEPKSLNKYQFMLERDKAGYSDASWRNILREGRKLQEPHYDEAVETVGETRTRSIVSGLGRNHWVACRSNCGNGARIHVPQHGASTVEVPTHSPVEVGQRVAVCVLWGRGFEGHNKIRHCD